MNNNDKYTFSHINTTSNYYISRKFTTSILFNIHYSNIYMHMKSKNSNINLFVTPITHVDKVKTILDYNDSQLVEW